MPAAAARVLALAFDPDVRPVEDPVSERILDAALELAALDGLRHLTMDEVAERAEVGRMTVYRRFGSRTALLDTLSVRECRRCLAEISTVVEAETTTEERLAAMFTATLRVIREHPLLARLARAEPQSLVRELTRDSSAVFRLVHEFLIALIGEAQASGELAGGDPAVLAELWLRLGLSFVLMPQSALPTDDEAALRRLVASTLMQGART
jgi:AcrR family transcriptional regulator